MFPDIYVTYEASTVMLSPKTYCNPNSFLFRENSSDIVIAAHRFLNRLDNNTGCPQGQIRASVRYQQFILISFSEGQYLEEFSLQFDNVFCCHVTHCNPIPDHFQVNFCYLILSWLEIRSQNVED